LALDHSIGGYHARGLAYEKKGETDKAIADYRASLAAWPWDKTAETALERLSAAR
jgi:hypothetical protein